MCVVLAVDDTCCRVIFIVQDDFCFSDTTWDFWNFIVCVSRFIYLDLLHCFLPTTVRFVRACSLLEICGIYLKNRISKLFTASGYLNSMKYGCCHSWAFKCGIAWRMIGCADILLNWIQFAQKNSFGRNAGMSATISMKHTGLSGRGKRPPLLQWARIMFLILSSSMDCQMLLSRVAAISLDCRRFTWRRLRNTLLSWHRQRHCGTETLSRSWE